MFNKTKKAKQVIEEMGPVTDQELRSRLKHIEKQGGFFRNMLSTMCGIFLAFGAMFVMMMLNLIFLLASSDGVEVRDNSVLVLNLKGEISEKADIDVIGKLTGDDASTIGLNDILSAINKAEHNPNIKGIYLETGLLETDYATLQEIRQRLEKFKKSGKWIISYADQYMQGSYYLASVANKVYLNPQGLIDWHGVASQPIYYKDLMAKFGVKMNVVKVGKFKSFTERYTEDHMSPENREQVSRYISGIWQNVTAAVSESRKISADSLNVYADSLTTYDAPELLVARKMVDGLLYADQIKDVVRKQLALDSDDAIPQITLAQMRDIRDDTNDGGDEIAVYYCSGSIAMNNVTGLVTGGSGIVAHDVIADLQKLADDDDVKAVVIRINSGGGDAYASEQLWRAVSLLKAKKPVVISMGGAAASGAYYMSCNASWIVAQPTTLTGSIGIFGAFPDFSGLLTEKLGVRYDEVSTNKHSSFSPVGLSRPLNADEVAILQRYVNHGYDLFRKRVADGRRKSVDEIEKIAQGRVWLGEDAIKLGLVDQLGSLDDAVKKASQLAKLDGYHTTDYPAPMGFLESLLKEDRQRTILDDQLRHTLGIYYQPMLFLRNLSHQSPIQARLPIELNIR